MKPCRHLAGRLLVLCLLLVGTAQAQEDAGWQYDAQTLLTSIRAEIDRPATSEYPDDIFIEWSRLLAGIHSRAQSCVDDLAAEQARLRAQLTALGEPLPVTSTDIAAKTLRRSLEERLAKIDKQLTSCRTLLIDSQGVGDALERYRKQILESYLLARSMPVWDIVIGTLSNPAGWVDSARAVLKRWAEIAHQTESRWPLLALAGVLGLFVGLGLRHALRTHLHRPLGEDLTARFLTAAIVCLEGPLPLLMALGSIAVAMWAVLSLYPMPPSMALVVSLTIYLLAQTVVRIALAPPPPATVFLPLDAALAKVLYRRLRTLLLLGLLGVMGYVTGLENSLLPIEWLALRTAFVVLVSINLLWILSALGRLRRSAAQGWLRAAFMLSLVFAIVAELCGLHNLAFFILRGLIETIAAGLLAWLLSSLVGDFFDGLDEGHYRWQQHLRSSLGLVKGQTVPGMIWLRLALTLVIWLSFVMAVVRFWGYTGIGWAELWEGVVNGFAIGSFRVVPAQLFLALVVFVVSLALVGWIKRSTLPRIVARTRLDRGGREAVVTISGYVGVIVAALLALSLAGFDFTNLAIVAGALSVGIGFGLQNIVNNFVSGIILLFERPIRTNDWVIVGSTEGYVRRISIRSTLIETFDRADVIVPNSELISSQVTNMTLRDPWGRLIVPIGVAYGSDVGQVRDVLLAIAETSPLVIRDNPMLPPPKVLFRGFGESALNFELRCFVRMVDKRLDVLSEINFAIDKAFREEGIEIPFPQRDLHLRSTPPGFVTFSNDREGSA